jgi:hypothetical protein
MSHLRVALNLPRTVPHAIVYAQSILAALKGNPAHPTPTPNLATFEAHLAALEASHVATLTRASGMVAERNARFATVLGDLRLLRSYVERVANQSPGETTAIIESSGMHVRGSPTHGKPPFEAKEGRVSGTVHLVARAAKGRASYDWQWSDDDTLWVDLPRSMRADATVSDLVAGRRYGFRYRTVTKEGVSDWSQVVTLLVG